LHQHVTADGFDIEVAAEGLYDLILLIREKTGAPKVHIVAHSMGGLVARCMMQKVCLTADTRPDAPSKTRLPAKEIVSKFFTYGTPHGGISFEIGALDWAQQAFGPAGSDIFSPAKMYGYLTPGAKFGDTPGKKDQWDPQTVDPAVFDPGDIFCIVGTDPKDYGLSRVVVGPKSDGLVRIEHAYVRRAHRAFVYKSHSGTYGEVNSEEGYQNLRRFLFGRWNVQVGFVNLTRYPTDEAEAAKWAVWQADMRLAVRGLPVIMSEQQAEHWCPIQLNDEIKRIGDSADHPVPLLSAFLLDPERLAQKLRDRGLTATAAHEGRARYVMTLRVYQLNERGGVFRFADHLEQVPDWADSLIIDVGPTDAGGMGGWAAWNHSVAGPNAEVDPIGPRLDFQRSDDAYVARLELPAEARTLPILGSNAALTFVLHDRKTAS
jgi:pimeloyl-ACP methyl ester carboxylesterase